MTILRTSLAVSAAMAAALTLGLSPAWASTAICVGTCGVLGADGDVTAPPGSSTYGYVSTFGGVDGAGQIASVGGTNGSSFTTASFAATAGQALKYNFNFISSDGQALPGQFIYEDYGFVQLLNLDTHASITLFDARTEPDSLIVPGSGLPSIDPGVTLTPPTSLITAGTGAGGGPVWSPLGDYSGQCWGPGCGYTGWIASTYTIAQDGNYALTFGVSNWGDTVYDTGLAYSGIKIGDIEIDDSAVPEPVSWAMMVTGLGVVGAILRRRRGQFAAAT
ncbi:MAG: NF038132 family protein [Caulobacteraceae bacterium]